MPSWRNVGNMGERMAERFLRRNGFRILAKQYRSRFGEIDLIAEDGNEVVFVEVKYRRSDAFGMPEESVTPKKLEKIYLTGEQYLAEQRRLNCPFRIDVIAIDQNGIRHLKSVF